MAEAAERCSDLSRAAGERLAGSAPWVDRWLLVEVPGRWPRDVGSGDGLSDASRATVQRWRESSSERRRLLFVRRPGRAAGQRLAFVVRAQEDVAEVRRIELGTGRDLADVDLERAGDRTEAPLVLVCGHGSRDACCARRGTAVYDSLASQLGDEELWISSHHGGHRFAANMIALPAGLHFGRVEPNEAGEIVESALAGRIDLGNYRGRTCYAPSVQAVEHAIRSAHGLDRVEQLALVGVDGARVTFRTSKGESYGAEVVETEGPSVPPGCGEPPKTQAAWDVRLV